MATQTPWATAGAWWPIKKNHEVVAPKAGKWVLGREWVGVHALRNACLPSKSTCQPSQYWADGKKAVGDRNSLSQTFSQAEV